MHRSWLIGADKLCDIRLASPHVSRRHCRLTSNGSTWIVEDLGSTNGTFVNGVRIGGVVRVSPSDTITLGQSQPMPWPEDASPPLCGGPATARPRQLSLPAAGRPLFVGRSAACAVVLDFPMVSSRHAVIEMGDGGWEIRDLGSTNGTFVAGRRIDGPTPVRPGDEIGFGSHRLVLTSPDTPVTAATPDDGGGIEVADVAVDIAGHRLIEGVSLAVRPGELVGVMGPSGAGKSTLLATLTGSVRLASGRVLVSGVDLASRFDELRGQIGYVPQDDIMHAELTVGQALWYSARLRLPRDYTDAEIRGRVAAVLGQLGLADVEHTRIGTAERRGISGGQRKRVNVALELITDPPVLVLDEPTSGLSSTDALLLMILLRGLADEGKTVVLTIHQPGLATLSLMDALVVIARDRSSGEPGRLVWFGPAFPEAAGFFEPGNPSPDAEAVLRGLESRSVAAWQEAFVRSPFHRQWVEQRLSGVSRTALPRSPPPRSPVDTAAQWWVLVRRMLAIKVADRWSTLVLLAQAPIIAALVAIVFCGRARATIDHATWPNVAQALATTTFLMSLAAIWFGCSNATREIVGERAIYRRERMVGLSVYAYLAAKIVVMLGLCVVQCGILGVIVGSACDLQSAAAHRFAILLLAAMMAVMIGLCVSAIVRSSEAANGILPLMILPMVILGGILLPLPELPGPTAWLADIMPSRWAFEALLVAEAEARPTIEIPAGDTLETLGETRVEDMAENWFPVTGWRSSPDTPGWMLLASCLVGAVAVRTIMVQADRRQP